MGQIEGLDRVLWTRKLGDIPGEGWAGGSQAGAQSPACSEHLFRLFPPVNLGFDMDPPAQSTVVLG